VIAALELLLVPIWTGAGIVNLRGVNDDYEECLIITVERLGQDAAQCEKYLGPDFSDLILFIFGPIWLLGGIAFLVTAAKTSLILSSKGLDYSNGFFQMSGKWEDAESITLKAGREILTLRESRFEASRWLKWNYWSGSIRRLIPLSVFGRDWRGDSLGEDLRRFAPALFAEGESRNRN
jgi:hypothetical protein